MFMGLVRFKVITNNVIVQSKSISYFVKQCAAVTIVLALIIDPPQKNMLYLLNNCTVYGTFSMLVGSSIILLNGHTGALLQNTS